MVATNIFKSLPTSTVLTIYFTNTFLLSKNVIQEAAALHVVTLFLQKTQLAGKTSF